MQKVVIGLAVAAIAAAGGYTLTKNEAGPSVPPGQPAQPAADREEQIPAEDETAAEAVITYGQTGFRPETLRVRAGETVTVNNDSDRTIQFDSDPHPAHTDNTQLNIDTIRPGQSKTFTVSRTGTFGYHDHLNPDETGTIIVE